MNGPSTVAWLLPFRVEHLQDEFISNESKTVKISVLINIFQGIRDQSKQGISLFAGTSSRVWLCYHCNGTRSPLANIVLFGLPLKAFKTCLLGRGFHILIKNVSFSSPTDVGFHNPPHSDPSILVGTPPHVHPLRSSSASSLAHHLVFGSDIIYNSPSPSSPLADNVLFGSSFSRFLSRFLKRVC